MTARNFNLTGGSWFNDGYSLYTDEQGTGPDSNGVYRWDMKKTGTHLFSGAGNSFFTFTPGTTSSNGVWYAGGTTTRNAGVITTTGGQNDTWNEGDAFVNGVVPTSGGGSGATIDDAVGSLSNTPSFSEMDVSISALSPGGSDYAYKVFLDNVLLDTKVNHVEGTQSQYVVPYPASGQYGAWDLTVTQLSTVSIKHLRRLTLVEPTTSSSSTKKKVSCNFW